MGKQENAKKNYVLNVIPFLFTQDIAIGQDIFPGPKVEHSLAFSQWAANYSWCYCLVIIPSPLPTH